MPKNQNTHSNTAGIRRRDFIIASSAAAIGSIGLPTRLFAQSAKTQITFASARFFATDTMQQVIEKYNKSQNSVQVSYVELPPPSSSTEVHQQLVQQLARKAHDDALFCRRRARINRVHPSSRRRGADSLRYESAIAQVRGRSQHT